MLTEGPPPPLPPILSWEEIEAGAPGQLPLPGMGEEPTWAERIYVRLAQRWSREVGNLGVDQRVARALDELALSALRVARDNGERFTAVAQNVTRQNSAVSERRTIGWLDRLPWELVLGCHHGYSGQGIHELTENLNHHDSSIRVWMMDLGWIMRFELDGARALPKLLENVAGTLGGPERAWGLAGSLFTTEKDFYLAAGLWSAHDGFDEQYAKRRAIFQDAGLDATQEHFRNLEARCRAIVVEAGSSMFSTE